MDDCASVGGAVECTAGYCVDSAGQKIETGTIDPKCNPGTKCASCDPLAGADLPVTLGTILGVGTDSRGTTYMAEQVIALAMDRVFVSSGTELVRKRVTGSGARGGSADADYAFTFEDGATTQALLVQLRGGAASGMALGPAGGRGYIGDPGATTEMLTVQDESVVSGFTLRNLPREIAIEYVADVTDGTALVVTRPETEWQYTDFRVFYGGDGAVLGERHVVSVLRARDGGSTDIQFIVDGATYTAHFPWAYELADGGMVGQPGPATLDKNGVPVAMNRRFPNPTTLTDFTFSCL
jgi:hypothetical protein